ncbi:MAG: hypothetical protein ACRCSY_02630 [Cetobacterium sp.]
MQINITLENVLISYLIGSRICTLFVILIAFFKLRKALKCKNYLKSKDYKQGILEGISLLFIVDILLVKYISEFITEKVYDIVYDLHYKWIRFELDQKKISDLEKDIYQTNKKIERMIKDDENIKDVNYFTTKLIEKEIELAKLLEKYKR